MDRLRRLALLTPIAACGGASAAAVPVVDGFDEPPGELRLAGAIVFADGASVDGVEVAPARLQPAGELVVRFRSSVPGRYRVALRPPHDASRQVTRGGVGAPPPQLPLDPRASLVEIDVDDRGEAVFELSSPWHPRRAVLTIERVVGDSPVPAVQGPRLSSGAGLLASVVVETQPTAVRAAKAAGAVVVDGVLDEAVWVDAVAVPLAHSLEGEPADGEPTTVRFAWDGDALYVAAELPDADAWSTFHRRDDPLWKEEAFEVFVFSPASDRDDASTASTYLELQVSPRAVQFDARFARHRDGDTAWDGSWTAAVELRGTLDDRSDRDQGWTAELRIPWSDICANTALRCPVAPGTTVRVNAFRLERPARGATVGLALSPTRVPDFHASANAAVLELAP